jgi:hypothetical protein
MQTKTYITIILLIVVSLAIIWAIRYVYLLEKPSPGNCDYIKASDPTAKWNNDCSYIQELILDPSMTTPSTPLYLEKFTASPSLGRPWGVNVWYKYKYVNKKTGGFSKSSPWTTTPIFSGSTKLPCDPTKSCPSGSDTCKANLPQLRLNNIAYPLGSDILVNVHRYVTSLNDTAKPTDSVDGVIVGTIIPTGNSSGTFIDTSKSPCEESTCNNILGC